MTRHLSIALAIVVLAAGNGGRCAVLGQTGAHGDGHAQHHDWYRSLTKPGTATSCCNAMRPDGEGDCRPVRAVLREGEWFALIPGEGWLPVPRDVILPDDMNREPLEAHACRSKAGTWHCFLRKGGGT
jgi:hypothetical protein